MRPLSITLLLTLATSLARADPTPVDLNSAPAAQLEQLPGIGPKRAQKIIDARPFRRIRDLRKIRGIGPTRLRRLRPLVTVTPRGEARVDRRRGSTAAPATGPRPKLEAAPPRARRRPRRARPGPTPRPPLRWIRPPWAPPAPPKRARRPPPIPAAPQPCRFVAAGRAWAPP